MAEKFLNIIQQFNQNELMQFLHKNGQGELEEFIPIEEVTDGQKFLNLDELQIIKWKLPLSTRKTLISFVEKVKTNPQNFLDQTELDNHFARRPSYKRIKTKFPDKSEPPIILPKPAEIKKKIVSSEERPSMERAESVPQKEKLSPMPQVERAMSAPEKPSEREKKLSVPEINKEPPVPKPRPRAPTPPTPASIEEESPESPVEEPEEYLNMEKSIEKSGEDRYDASGYLIPIEKHQIVEDNTYEPSPTENVVTGFLRPSSQRAPVALPRPNTDDRGYISGPENTTRSIPFMPTGSTSNLSTTSSTAGNEQDVAYEPIDYDEAGRNTNTQQRRNSLSFNKLKNYLPFTKRNKIADEIKNYIKPKPSPTESIPSPKPYARPLPPLPFEEDQAKTLPLPKIKTPVDEPLEEYVNVNKQITNHLRSKSESNLDDPVSYEDLFNTVKRSKTPEDIPIKTGKTGKMALPLPPSALLQFKLPADLPNSMSDDEDLPEEYADIVSNLFDEPFYRYTDRKGARMLLTDLDDGAFLFRPSKHFFLTLSLKYNDRYFNLGITKTDNNKLRLNTSGNNMSPEFPTLSDFVEYFTTEKITFDHKGEVIETLLVKSLPSNKF